jgi:hypothetical protein
VKYLHKLNQKKERIKAWILNSFLINMSNTNISRNNSGSTSGSVISARRRAWTGEEDIACITEVNNQLVNLGAASGKSSTNLSRFIDWAKVEKVMSGSRTARQCKERWRLRLDPELNKEPWRTEEDKLLMQLQETHGNKWAAISESFPGRSDHSCKIRWRGLMRQQRRKPETLIFSSFGQADGKRGSTDSETDDQSSTSSSESQTVNAYSHDESQGEIPSRKRKLKASFSSSSSNVTFPQNESRNLPNKYQATKWLRNETQSSEKLLTTTTTPPLSFPIQNQPGIMPMPPVQWKGNLQDPPILPQISPTLPTLSFGRGGIQSLFHPNFPPTGHNPNGFSFPNAGFTQLRPGGNFGSPYMMNLFPMQPSTLFPRMFPNEGRSNLLHPLTAAQHPYFSTAGFPTNTNFQLSAASNQMISNMHSLPPNNTVARGLPSQGDSQDGSPTLSRKT